MGPNANRFILVRSRFACCARYDLLSLGVRRSGRVELNGEKYHSVRTRSPQVVKGGVNV